MLRAYDAVVELRAYDELKAYEALVLLFAYDAPILQSKELCISTHEKPVSVSANSFESAIILLVTKLFLRTANVFIVIS